MINEAKQKSRDQRGAIIKAAILLISIIVAIDVVRYTPFKTDSFSDEHA